MSDILLKFVMCSDCFICSVFQTSPQSHGVALSECAGHKILIWSFSLSLKLSKHCGRRRVWLFFLHWQHTTPQL